MNEMKTPMDCFEFCEIYLDLDRPATRAAELCDEALAHAESCTACATRLMESESLDFSLRKVAETAGRPQASARVEAALMEEFRRVHPARASRKVRWEMTWLAVAALILLALGLAIYRRHVGVPGGMNAPSSATKAAPEESRANPSGVQPSPAAPVEVAKVRSATNDAVDLDSGSNEYASAFVPLPYSDGLSDSDGGTVVRVDLPRSSLASMGIPVSGLAAGDRVVADLVVSEDGTPQAIRLVSQAN
jgi:hypothetical protein